VGWSKQPGKVTIMIARLTYDGWERVEVGHWLAQNVPVLLAHPRVNTLVHSLQQGYPADRVRNALLTAARQNGYDYLLMLDNDMVFDIHAHDAGISYAHLPKYPDQVPFLPAALDFALAHDGPCVVGAPYCAGPPEERVLVSRFAEAASDSPDFPAEGFTLQPFAREEAATRTGYEQVPVLPTGLILIDTRVCEILGPPYFYYEFKTPANTDLASTEDTVFTRNLHYLGVPSYVAWCSWAAHVKDKIVGRPKLYPVGAIPKGVKEGYLRQEAREGAVNARPADRKGGKADG
jgi:hypothetical protein